MLRTTWSLLLALKLTNLLAMASSIAAASPSTSRSFVVIVAATAGSLGIGKNGALPWRLAADMAYFKRCTSTPTASSTAASAAGKVNAVIMGRKTWQSIPERFRPLQGRRNVVLSRNPKARDDLRLPEDVLLAGSLTEALALLSSAATAAATGTTETASEVDKVFVIGGGSVYAEAVASKLCEKVLLTSVTPPADGRFDDCDVHFPALDPEIFKLTKKGEVQEEKGIEFSFDEYESVHHSEAAAGMAAAEGDKENTGGDAKDGADNVVGSKRKSCPIQGVAAEGVEPAAEKMTTTAAAGAGAVGAAATREEDGSGNEEEMQYLNLVQDILDNGVRRGDRTGTGTLSKFGVQMRFSLREDRFPLLTTKRVFWRGVAEELLWFVAGCTNANVLKDRGIHIWDGNGSREFLDG